VVLSQLSGTDSGLTQLKNPYRKLIGLSATINFTFALPAKLYCQSVLLNESHSIFLRLPAKPMLPGTAKLSVKTQHLRLDIGSAAPLIPVVCSLPNARPNLIPITF
jgi:hypothetical protein